MIYPSGRAVWAAAAGAVPAFLVALALPSLWYLGLLWICLLLAFLAVDAAAGRGRKSLAASLHAPPQVGVGGQFTVHVAARFSGRTRTLEARVGHDERLAPIGGTGGPLAPTKRRRIARPAVPGAAARHRQLRSSVAALARAVRTGLEPGRPADGKQGGSVARRPQRPRPGDHAAAAQRPARRACAAPGRPGPGIRGAQGLSARHGPADDRLEAQRPPRQASGARVPYRGEQQHRAGHRQRTPDVRAGRRPAEGGPGGGGGLAVGVHCAQGRRHGQPVQLRCAAARRQRRGARLGQLRDDPEAGG